MTFDFKKLLTARFLLTIAVEMQAIVLGWQVYSLTKNPLYLGLVGLADALPALSIALYAGYLVDRGRPLKILNRVVEGSMLSAILLLATKIFATPLGLHGQVLLLFSASFVTGATRGFTQPAIFSAAPRLLPRDQLSKAAAWLATAMQSARISGPALGGILFAAVGVQWTAIVILTFLAGARLTLTFIENDLAPANSRVIVKSLGAELLSGAKFVFQHPILFPALSLDMLSVFFGGVTALLPIFASEILGTGPAGLGALRAAPALGATLMGLYLTRKNLGARAGTFLFSAVAAFGVCILIFALSRSVSLSLAALFFSGVFDSVSMVVRGSAVQLASPDAMRGRISAVNSMFIGSSNELGEFESGVAARFLGTVPAVIFGGCMCLVTVIGVAILSPSLRRLDLKKLAEESTPVQES